jgi:uncharacterized protein YybS (DUF2232 family)
MNLFAFFFLIFLSLVSLFSIIFGEYLLIKFNIKINYPKIFKYIQIRRKFQRYYIIVESLIIMTIILLRMKKYYK